MARPRYASLGVDVHKAGIEAFRDSVSGLYKHAFCDLHRDPDIPECLYTNKPDGAGSKPVQNYLNWRESSKIEAFSGIPQDVLGMTMGDAFCVGVPTFCSFTDYIAINKMKVPKEEILQLFAKEWTTLLKRLKNNYGINIQLDGGETADLPDQLRTLDVVGNLFARYKDVSVITGEKIRPGDLIIGLASDGCASYEDKPAGAIMCNGLTLARHCLMRHEYGEKYPEIHEPGKDYTGPFSPNDTVSGIDGTIGEELTRPTRIFAPIFKSIIETFGGAVHGIVFNTGGGNTKCLRVGRGIRYVKDNMPELPAIFRLVQEHGKVSWREMYVDLNMGVGAELYVDPDVEDELISKVKEDFWTNASRIGECRSAGRNKVRLETAHGNFNYS